VRRTTVLVALALVVVTAAAIGTVALLTRPRIPAELAGLTRVELLAGGATVSVVLAQDRARGLMGIADLGEIDGMLFAYDDVVDPADHRFWMQGVLIPLDISFIDPSGLVVDRLKMPLCPAGDQAERSCPLYAARAPFRWALETPAGRIVLPAGERIAGLP
jgi:uncharacterized membrane protein (UPF0127 family)